MEGDIGRSHIIIAFFCPEVANKNSFESTRGELGHGRRVILDKGTTTKGPRRKGEESEMGKRR